MPETPSAVARCVLPVHGPSNQHHVVGFVAKAQVSQLINEAPVHAGLSEVETGQIPVNRETCRRHLVADRAHDPIRPFGLEQMA